MKPFKLNTELPKPEEREAFFVFVSWLLPERLQRTLRRIAFGERRKKMRTYLIIISSWILIPITGCFAQDNKTLSDNRHVTLSEIEKWIGNKSEEDCEEVFNYLWPMAKEENPNAIATLMSLTFSLGLNMPGRGMDYISRLRDYQILSVYGLDSSDENFYEFSSYYLSVFNVYKDFKNCHEQARKKCSSLLAGGAIPTFEDYAREIDVFLKAGYKPTCSPSAQVGQIEAHC